MNSNTYFRRLDGFGQGKLLEVETSTIHSHAVIGYLMSIGDVLVALSIMITICGLSLLTLYSAVGAL